MIHKAILTLIVTFCVSSCRMTPTSDPSTAGSVGALGAADAGSTTQQSLIPGTAFRGANAPAIGAGHREPLRGTPAPRPPEDFRIWDNPRSGQDRVARGRAEDDVLRAEFEQRASTLAAQSIEAPSASQDLPAQTCGAYCRALNRLNDAFVLRGEMSTEEYTRRKNDLVSQEEGAR